MNCISLSSSTALDKAGPTLSEDGTSVVGTDFNITLKDYFEQMLVGLMLSDGTLTKKYVGGNAYYQMAQSIIHLPYITHVHSLFLACGCTNMLTVVKNVRYNKAVGKAYTSYTFTSRSLPLFTVLHSL